MPHFIRTTVREDGSLKLREVTDAASKADGGMSFNDNIPKEETNLAYIAIVALIHLIVSCKLEWLVMADAVNAFKRVPIADKYIKYFGIKIGEFIFYWTCLTFGGASSCRIYGWFAAYVVWIIVNHNKRLFIVKKKVVLKNYLDDFIAGHRTYLGAWKQYFAILLWFSILGIPTQVKKMCIPTKILKFIGYIINLITQELIIPFDKILKVKELGQEILVCYRENRQVEVRKLQSFCGIVRFITPVYYYLIPFLRAIEQAIGSRDKSEKVWITKDIEIDIVTIIRVIMNTGRNRIKFEWLTYKKCKGDIVTETDASGNIGMGGLEKKKNGIYFQVNYNQIPKWTKEKDPDIVWKELAAVWIMHKLQKKAWTSKAVTCLVDNKAVEAIMIKKKACFERKDLQVLVRGICEHSMNRNYWHWYDWISTKANKYADGLSRNEPEVIKELPYTLQNRSEKALRLAIEAYDTYLEQRTRMKRKKNEKKQCFCEGKNRCKEQDIYAPTKEEE